MESLADELSEHMDESERTIQGAFCALINWGMKTVERLGVQHRNEVIGTCGRWWLAHEPSEDPSKPWLAHGQKISLAWIHLGECIAELIDTVEVVEAKT